MEALRASSFTLDPAIATGSLALRELPTLIIGDGTWFPSRFILTHSAAVWQMVHLLSVASTQQHVGLSGQSQFKNIADNTEKILYGFLGTDLALLPLIEFQGDDPMQTNVVTQRESTIEIPYNNPLENNHSQIDVKNLIHDYVANMGFPCVGAKTALSKDQIEICVADSIFSNHSDEEILSGLYQFIATYQKDKAIFRSFIVVFKDQELMDEEDFESALWTRLQSLHDKDIYPWDSAVSQNPEDKTFSFSAGNKAFYIVGMHPGSSRKARRFPLPALVFNMHEQFEQLRASGQYQKMRSLIRRRDEAFSGSSNPMLEDFGDNSEAIQYSGRQVSGAWKCPFHNKGLH